MNAANKAITSFRKDCTKLFEYTATESRKFFLTAV